jgi:hypothetical protein
MRILLFTIVLLLPLLTNAQSGCTDPQASNYNASATINDGSCVYPAVSVTPYNINVLNDTVAETSGLVWYNGLLWTHNDNADQRLYALDTTSGQIAQRKTIINAANIDWEEIAQDDDYFYVGDFGNNVAGNRTDLRIFRISKNTLGSGNLTVDTIRFAYSDQTDFSNTGPNNTDFDCEAFIATDDSLYLFTKQWVSRKTSVYVLPKLPSPNVYAASKRATHDVQGLVTGATFLKGKKTIVLCGYQANLANPNPFVYLLYDFSGNNFFSGNKRKVEVVQPLSQTEGIATVDGRSFFLTNEAVVNSAFTIPARLQKIDLTALLGNYYQTDITSLPGKESLLVFPNPARGSFAVNLEVTTPQWVTLSLTDIKGRKVMEERRFISRGRHTLQVTCGTIAGAYQLTVLAGNTRASRTIMFNR